MHIYINYLQLRAVTYRNRFLFRTAETIKILNPFAHLSMHQLSQCLRGTPTIIHGPRFITHNSGSRIRIFSRRYLGTYGCGIKKPERRWKDLSIEFHERRPLRVLTPPTHTHTRTHTHTPVAPFLSILQRHRRPINIRARFSNRIGRKKWKVISLRTIDRRVSAMARPLSRCHDSGSFQGTIALNAPDKSATFFKIYRPALALWAAARPHASDGKGFYERNVFIRGCRGSH